jgi:hypothetical protein
MRHLAGASALTLPAFALTRTLRAHAASLSRNHKSAILLWLGGGPPSIDMWDMKPGAPTGGPLKPISTTGDFQICERLPLLAEQMKDLSVVRSMSTREADHDRGRYYMHTGFVPNPMVEHPGYGSVVAHEMENKVPELEIPPFVSIGGPSEGPGFLGMAYAPFQVDANGQIRDVEMSVPWQRMADRMQLLAALETRFIEERRGSAAEEHAKVLAKTHDLLTSEQMSAFKVRSEPREMLERYGDNNFGRGCLMARRLVEVGVPFVEVNSGGWDLHQGCFTSLDTKLPELDKAFAALVDDLREPWCCAWASSAARRGLTVTRAAIILPARGAWCWAARRFKVVGRLARRSPTARASRASRIRPKISWPPCATRWASLCRPRTRPRTAGP